MTKTNFPLLNQIDQGLQADQLDWNQNAFQTLLTSNLPTPTIFHYAIEVGLRRLEQSLYETYWDATADALNDLTQFLFNSPIEHDIDGFLFEARCQLLMYAAVAMIKMNTIRRRSTNDAKMSCATICSLLLQQKQSYEISNNSNEYSTCCRSMRSRYLKRNFIIVQWLPTLSKGQLEDFKSNHERYIALLTDQLFPSVSLREKINQFIETQLYTNQQGDEDYVFIRRFPMFDEKNLEQRQDLMRLGLVNSLDQLNENQGRKLICCIWTLCCMIEGNRVSLDVFNAQLINEDFSLTPVDFEIKPIRYESLNQQDLIVFLLLCAQQNVQFNGNDSTLHPYLLYSSSYLCTQQQKTWWQTAIEQTSSNDFLDHLATIRLNSDRIQQHPPKLILSNTAKILFQHALHLYEQNIPGTVYEQYARHYLDNAKRERNVLPGLSDSFNKTSMSSSKSDKLFFFYAEKYLQTGEKNRLESLFDQCEKLAQQCEQSQIVKAESPRTSSPSKDQQDINISSVLSPVPDEEHLRTQSDTLDSTLFATPPANKSRDIEVQTFRQSPSPPPSPVIVTLPADPPLPSWVEMIFSHMNDVNQSINTFCANHQAIENDIQTIRERLDKVNRATSQMLFSNSEDFFFS